MLACSVVGMIAAGKASHMAAAFGQTFRLPDRPLHRLPGHVAAPASWPR
jgi:hypothetical protein